MMADFRLTNRRLAVPHKVTTFSLLNFSVGNIFTWLEEALLVSLVIQVNPTGRVGQDIYKIYRQ